MAKLVSPAMSSMLNQQHASEPIIVVAIRWGTSLNYYSTKFVENAGIYCKGIIKSVGSLGCGKRQDNLGSTGSLDIEFFDLDGEFKLLMDAIKIEGTSVTVYQHFEGLTANDWMELLHGRICKPVWTEGDRVFKCTIECRTISDEIGYAAIPADFADLASEAYGVPWPMLFGEVVMSPCVHVRRKADGFLKTDIAIVSGIYNVTNNGATITWPKPEDNTVASYYEDTTTVIGKMFIKGGDKFPQGQQVKIVINEVIFKGSFASEEFTVTAANLPKYEGIKFADRVGGDPDNANYLVAWLPNVKPYPNLIGCYLILNKDEGNLFKVVKQDGRKVWFKSPIYAISAVTGTYIKTLVDSSQTIKQAFPIEPSATQTDIWEFVRRSRMVQQKRKTAFDPTSTKSANGLVENMLDKIIQHGHGMWRGDAGAKVKLWSSDADNDPDIYVMSLVQLSEVKAVYGKKKVKIGKTEYITFAPIPTSYYTVQLASNYTVENQTASALIFYQPLSDYDTDVERWEEVVYVSVVSTVGPNTADIIQWILENYTSYRVDEDAFSRVAGQLSYDSNFGIYDRRDALQVCQNIAWQARCALLVDSENIGIVYLAHEPTPAGAFSESSIQFKSLEFTTSESTDITTRLIGTWRETQEWFEPPSRVLNTNRGNELRDIIRAVKDSERKEVPATNYVFWEENIEQFGLKVKTVDIFIYNEEEPVQKTIDFWGHLGANVWKMLQFKTVLLALPLQTFDAMNISLALLGGIKALVYNMGYDSKEKDVDMVLWLPVKAGTQIKDSTVWNG